jgi:hypothetical protein
MKKFLHYIGVLLVLLLLSAISLDNIYTQIYKNVVPQNKAQYINSLKDKKIDYIFIGSSRVENSIVSNKIEEETNKRTVNLGIKGLKLRDMTSVIKLLKNNNITFDKLFIQLDYSYNYESEYSKFYSFELLPYYNSTNSIIDEYIENTNKNHLFYKFIPFYKYTQSEELIGFRKIISSLKNKNSILETNNGYQSLKGVSSKQSENIPNEIILNNKYFEELNHFVKSNNIEVVYFSAPISIKTKNPEYFNLLSQVIPNLHDFHNVVSDEKYFYDNLHLNNEGAEYFTNILINELNL